MNENPQFEPQNTVDAETLDTAPRKKSQALLWLILLLCLIGAGLYALSQRMNTTSQDSVGNQPISTTSRQTDSSYTDSSGVEFITTTCAGKMMYVVDPANSFSQRMIVPEGQVTNGVELTALLECYFQNHERTDLIIGSIGTEAHEAQSKLLADPVNRNALSVVEKTALDTMIFSAQRNTTGGENDISLPDSGIFSR